MNFQLSGHRTASPDLNAVNYKIRASSLPEKAQDVNDLRRHLIDV